MLQGGFTYPNEQLLKEHANKVGKTNVSLDFLRDKSRDSVVHPRKSGKKKKWQPNYTHAGPSIRNHVTIMSVYIFFYNKDAMKYYTHPVLKDENKRVGEMNVALDFLSL